MAVVIPFEDIVRARRRQRERAYTERCVELIDATLEMTVDLFDAAVPAERPLYARRIRQLNELRDYAVQRL